MNKSRTSSTSRTSSKTDKNEDTKNNLFAFCLCSQAVLADELDITGFPKMKEAQTIVYQGVGADTKISRHIMRVL